MEAGRELDALVAEKVMGLSQRSGSWFDNLGNKLYSPASTYSDDDIWLPEYSTDIKAAWEVAEKSDIESLIRIEDGRWIANVVGYYDPNEGTKAWPRLNEYYEISIYEDAVKDTIGKSAPHAICLAALKAMGVNVE